MRFGSKILKKQRKKSKSFLNFRFYKTQSPTATRTYRVEHKEVTEKRNWGSTAPKENIEVRIQIILKIKKQNKEIMMNG